MDETIKPKSIIHVEFSDVGSVQIVNFRMDNVTTLQVLALASLLDAKARNDIQREEERIRIQIPPPDLEKMLIRQ